MCGLFGWQLEGVASSDRAILAATLALGNATRGSDSWGFWSPGMPPARGLGDMSLSVSAKALASLETLCAHTRFATNGAVTVENSHPFTHGAITGAHNGAIYNKAELELIDPVRKGFAVDSMHLIAHIAERKSARELQGYGAVCYTDANVPGAVFLSRFCSGELAVARVKGGIVWSSDEAHLDAALKLAGMKGFYCNVKETAVYVVQNGAFLKTQERLKVRPMLTYSTRRHAVDMPPAPREIFAGWDEENDRRRIMRERLEARCLRDELEDGWDLLTANEKA